MVSAHGFTYTTPPEIMQGKSCKTARKNEDGTEALLTYHSYFRSFSSDYDSADSLAGLAEDSDVATKATLADVEEGRI